MFSSFKSRFVDVSSSIAIDGGTILSKALGEPRALGTQLMLFRSYIALLFTPTNH
ncbi:MAG: hypothetical protein V7703_05795 [Hyphomicrobiales bacterium]